MYQYRYRIRTVDCIQIAPGDETTLVTFPVLHVERHPPSGHIYIALTPLPCGTGQEIVECVDIYESRT